MVENLPAMWETWVRSLGWEDPLEKGKATHSSILAWRIPRTEGVWQATVHGVQRVRHNLATFTRVTRGWGFLNSWQFSILNSFVSLLNSLK